MAIATEKFVRKPLFVDAVRVTPENFLELSFWCQGSIRNNDGSDLGTGTQIDPAKQHIQVRVHNPKNSRQTKAYVGDWILYTERGYKVYTDKAFKSSFDAVDNVAAEPDSSPQQDQPSTETETEQAA